MRNICTCNVENSETITNWANHTRDIRGTWCDLCSVARNTYDNDQSCRAGVSISIHFYRFCDDYTGSHSHRVASVVSRVSSSLELRITRRTSSFLLISLVSYIEISRRKYQIFLKISDFYLKSEPPLEIQIKNFSVRIY